MPRRTRKHSQEKESETKPYVWVKDASGDEYLCPRDALKNPQEAKEGELESCIDVEPLKKYLDE